MKKQKSDQRHLTDDQKQNLLRQKLQPKGVLTGSRSMVEVQKTMAGIYRDQSKNVVKYLSSYNKDENTLSKPLYQNIMDLIKKKQANSIKSYQTFDKNLLVDSPLINEECQQHENFQKKKQLYVDLFPKKQETSRKIRNMSSPEFGDNFFITENHPKNKRSRQEVKVIDSEEKLKKFEQEKKKLNIQVIRKLGIMNDKDKKLMQIQDLQARALKMRLKFKENPIYDYYETTNKAGQDGQKRPQTQQLTTRTKFTQLSNNFVRTSSTSPDAARSEAHKRQLSHLDEVIESSPCQLLHRKHRPQTQRTKKKILTFIDDLAKIEFEERQCLQKDQEWLKSTMGDIMKELECWKNNLLDKNDELDKNITNQIKEQVLQYKNEHNQVLIKR